MIRTVKGAALLAAASALLATGACSSSNGGQVGEAAGNGGSGRPAVAVSVEAACTSDILDTIDVVGSLSPKFSADVKSEISGTVTEVYVTQWVPVRKGAPLARLDTSETEAVIDALKAVVAQAEVAETRARREQERARQLNEYGLITQQAFDEAASALEAAQAGTRAARAQVRTAEARLAKASIHAPIDGIVAERNVNVGDRVENMGGNASMFRIVDNRLLDLTVTVPSGQMPKLHVGQQLDFTTDAAPGRDFTGVVMFINPAVDAASRSAKVVAEVANPDRALRGGLFVRGHIIAARTRDAIVVRRDALLDWNVAQRTASVFVVANGKADKRAVRVGATAGDQVEITEGLAVGEPVVTRGAFTLRPGDQVTLATNGKS